MEGLPLDFFSRLIPKPMPLVIWPRPFPGHISGILPFSYPHSAGLSRLLDHAADRRSACSFLRLFSSFPCFREPIRLWPNFGSGGNPSGFPRRFFPFPSPSKFSIFIKRLDHVDRGEALRQRVSLFIESSPRLWPTQPYLFIIIPLLFFVRAYFSLSRLSAPQQHRR